MIFDELIEYSQDRLFVFEKNGVALVQLCLHDSGLEDLGDKARVLHAVQQMHVDEVCAAGFYHDVAAILLERDPLSHERRKIRVVLPSANDLQRCKFKRIFESINQRTYHFDFARTYVRDNLDSLSQGHPEHKKKTTPTERTNLCFVSAVCWQGRGARCVCELNRGDRARTPSRLASPPAVRCLATRAAGRHDCAPPMCARRRMGLKTQERQI